MTDQLEYPVALYRALFEFQGKVEPITKDANNPITKSKYVTLANLIETIRPVLIECGLGFVQLLQQGETGAAIETIIYHAESGQSLSSIVDIPSMDKVKGRNELQALGWAITYLKRYALEAALGISRSEDDNDGNSPNNLPARAATKTQAGLLARAKAEFSLTSEQVGQILKDHGYTSFSQDRYDDMWKVISEAT